MSFEIPMASSRILTLLLFLLCGEKVFAQSYSITNLGVPPGGTVASGINNLGTVVGGSDGTGDADYNGCGFGRATKPFIWTAASGLQVLGPSPTLDIFGTPLKACAGTAVAINDDGAVVGSLNYGFAGRTRSFIWTAGTGMQLIPAGPGGGHRC